MNEESTKIVGELEKIAADAQKSFGALTAGQINWRPPAGAWSVGQCFEHLIKSNASYFPEFDKVIAGARQNSLLEQWSPLTSFAGKLLLDSLRAEGRKVKTIDKMSPPSEVAADVIDEFAAHQALLVDKIRQMAGADWKKIVLTSPFMGLMTYTLADGVQAIVEHERRHFRQAEKVMQTEGFPQ